MASPILVTGAAGRVGAVGRTITELLLSKAKRCARWCEVRINARRIARHGAEVVAGAGRRARVIAMLLADPRPHIGKTYYLTGPQSENMDLFASEYSKAFGRTITYHDIPS
jgi:hypothetical protein